MNSLLEISSKVVARSFPFQYIEELYSQIPTPVILSIVKEAFPQEEGEVRVYAGGGWEGGLSNWERGLGILDSPAGVSKVVQVGKKSSLKLTLYTPKLLSLQGESFLHSL